MGAGPDGVDIGVKTTLIGQLLEGIRPVQGGFEIDFDEDRDDDFINLTSVETRSPRQGSDIAYYSPFLLRGSNNDAISRFRHALKDFDTDQLHGMTVAIDGTPQYSFERLMAEGARRFVEKTGQKQFAMAITPHPTGTPQLCNQMVASLRMEADIAAIFQGGIIKSSLDSVRVDEERLIGDLMASYPDPNEAERYRREVFRQLDRAKRSGRFKMRDIVGNWRKYITGFLEFNSQINPDKLLDALSLAETLPIVFVDDFNTTGSTIREAARVIREFVPNAQLYAYTFCRSVPVRK